MGGCWRVLLRLRARVRPRRPAWGRCCARCGAASPICPSRSSRRAPSAVPAGGRRALRVPRRGLRHRPRAEKRARHRRGGHRRGVAALPGRLRRARGARSALAARARRAASSSATFLRSRSTPPPRPASRRSALANFSWDWIYRHLAVRQPALHEAAEPRGGGVRAGRPAARAALRRRPLGLPAPRRIPLVARRPRRRSRRRRADGSRLDAGPWSSSPSAGWACPASIPACLRGCRRSRFVLDDRRRGPLPRTCGSSTGRDRRRSGSTTSTSSAPPTSWSPSPGTGSCPDAIAARHADDLHRPRRLPGVPDPGAGDGALAAPART